LPRSWRAPRAQIAFCCIAYPSLVITYFGQAAFLMANPDQVGSTFFASIPFGDGFYWTFFVIATAAACVASQARGWRSTIEGASGLVCEVQTLSHACGAAVGRLHTREQRPCTCVTNPALPCSPGTQRAAAACVLLLWPA